MTDRFAEVLSGKEDNYLLPFLWQHGEDESVIREEMARVFDAGIRAVCVEARPHPDFAGPRWWHDMDIILDEARTRGMRVWLLDDDHFPTGHAVGKMKDAPIELRRLFLREGHLDVIGPRKKGSFLVRPFLMDFFKPLAEGVKLVAVVAVRRDVEKDRLTGEMHDLTGCIQGDFLYWDVPEGCWRIFYMVSSPDGGSEHEKDYTNPIVAESTQVLIDAVYETHYAHYKDDFGHTFAGFFSDEPAFYNDNLHTFGYQSGLGQPGVTLPWRADLLERLAADSGLDYRQYLPLLWHQGGEMTRVVRYTYMDVVSRLYAENFTKPIGDWCRAHHVEYIGHVIEDNGAHARLGPGTAHYFRALWDQDMAGLDIVLWQLAPAMDGGYYTNATGEGDGEFYHYGLAKMGASLGHMDPKKRGRTMCELFGAYGWAEGLRLMKWMTDHLLVRGVNYFVPHAFSQAEFPDPDCPPHLYARGRNPQYRYYQALNQYTNRISHLLSGGLHIASVAVLYHAEAEWASASTAGAVTMPFQRPARVLMQRQIDYDVLPADILIDSVEVIEGALRVAAETYRALVVPECQSLPERVVARLIELAERGLPVLFVNRLPEETSDRVESSVITRLANQAGVQVLSLGDLAGYVRDRGWHEIETATSEPYLRSFHIHHENMDVFMFVNEHPQKLIDTRVSIPGKFPAVGYDALQNRVVKLNASEAHGRISFSLRLAPSESVLVIAGEAARGLEPGAVEMIGAAAARADRRMELTGPWAVSTADALSYPTFTPWQSLAELVDLSGPGLLPAFSGTFRYETGFAWNQAGASAWLDLGDVYETAEVWLNGQRCGLRICPPYLFELQGLRPGQNRLVIEVTNTLAKQQQDVLSRFTMQDPSGLLGPVEVKWVRDVE